MLNKLILFANGLWLMQPMYALFLAIDAIVYSLVAYSYRIFMLMTQLNYNAIYEMIYPLIDRVKALIIVFVLFKVAVFLIQCLIDPDKLDDKTAKGGKQLVINILVCAGVMGLSPFVFDLANDLSMAMLGNTTGASYQVLPGGSSDGGLIMRLVFGNSNSADDIGSYGVFLAASTLNIFLHSEENSDYYVADAIFNKIVGDAGEEGADFNFFKIITLTDDIGRTVVYQFPILSTVVGLFIIYSLVKISIEVGIRMFKLVVLQIIAPIPIASIISDGIGGKKFTDFYKLYISTFTQIFIRVATLYLVTAFIGQFFTTITNGGTGLITVDASNFTKFLILIIVIISGYTFVNILPKFIGDLFGLNMGEGGKGGFGKFMKGLAGAGIGAVGGFAVSRAAGLGVMSSLGNALNAGYNGTKGGKIADNIKNAAGRAAAGYAAGGMFRSTLNGWDQALGLDKARQTNAQMKIDNINEGPSGMKAQQEKIDKLKKIQEMASKEVAKNEVNFGSYGSQHSVTSAEDLYRRAHSSDAQIAEIQYNLKNASSAKEQIKYQKQLAAREKFLQEDTLTAYNVALNNTQAVSETSMDLNMIEAEVENLEKSVKSKQKEIDALNKQKEGPRYTRNN